MCGEKETSQSSAQFIVTDTFDTRLQRIVTLSLETDRQSW